MLAIGTWILLTVTALIGVAYLVNLVLGSVIFRKRKSTEPPIVKGHWLWGSGDDFSTHAVNFLHRKRKEYGNVFTIRLVNKYLTVIMDPHSIEAMSKERNFDFDPIQKQVNSNVFNFVLKEPRKMIKDTGRTVRGPYLDRSLRSFSNNLSSACERVLTDSPREWHSDGLRLFAAKTMFDAIFNTIFGNSYHPTFNSMSVYHNFEIFHHYFNYLWLGFPGFLFPKAGACAATLKNQPLSEDFLNRADSSDYIKASIDYMKLQGQTEEEIQGHNLVYLHVNYTTFRLAFWVLVNILENPVARKALQEELQDAVEARLDETTNTAEFTPTDVESLKVLDSICQESTRLSSGVFIVRYIKEDTMFKVTESGEEFLMREGDRVAIYPPAIHKDPEIFEEPLEFKYDRFIDAKFYKNGKELKNPLPAFGTLCPGKRYALLQLKWYILSVMTRFEFERKGEEKAQYDTQYHGHEILPPLKDVDIAFREKESFPQVQITRD